MVIAAGRHRAAPGTASSARAGVVRALSVLVLFGGGCQSLVGIHAARDAGGDQTADLGQRDGSAVSPAADASAVDVPARATGGSAATGGGRGGGSGATAGAGGTSARDAGEGPSSGGSTGALGGNALPPGGALGGSSGLAGGGGPSSPDAAVADATGDATDGSVPCPVDAGRAAPLLQGTVFQYSAGPNGMATGGMGMCGFATDQLPAGAGHFYAAIDTTLMGNAAALCGVCLRATTVDKNSAEVMIIDALAPNAGSAKGYTLAFDRPALTALAAAGQNIAVDFEFVPCSDPGTVQVKFVSTMDASVIIMGARNQLQSVQISSANGPFQDMKRQMHNYWFPPMNISGAAGRVTLRVTDILGNVLTLANLVVDATTFDTRQQFPTPSCR